MKSLEILQQQLIEAQEELKPLLKYNMDRYLNKCTGDLTLLSRINPLITRIYNLKININQLKQRL
jgi:hypothetical protein